MLIQLQRYHVMPTRMRNPVAHAQPAGTTSRHAHRRAEADLAAKRVAQQALAADGALRPRDRRYFESSNQLDWISIYGCAAAEAQDGRPRENGISILYSRNRECGMREVILPCPIS
jgi:hypothetical protein